MAHPRQPWKLRNTLEEAAQQKQANMAFVFVTDLCLSTPGGLGLEQAGCPLLRCPDLAPICLQPLFRLPQSWWVPTLWGGRACPQQEALSETEFPAAAAGESCSLLYPPEPQVPGSPHMAKASLCPEGQEQRASCGGVPLPCSGQQPRCACLHSRAQTLKGPC